MLRNYSCRAGELDLVMADNETVAIIEVKARRSGALVSGPESVTPRKQKRIVLAALHMLQHHRELSQCAVRFDVVTVSLDPGRHSVDWIRDAFRAAL